MKDFLSFNRPPLTGNEQQYVMQAMASDKISGDGQFGKRCQQWFEERLAVPKTLLTPSCTHALEMAALLIDIQPGDEVIMPSYTFVSTANAFALRGARIVFVDVRPDTMNQGRVRGQGRLGGRRGRPVRSTCGGSLMGIPMRQAMRVGVHLMKNRLRRVERYPLIVELEPLFACNLECPGCGKIQYPAHILKQQLTPQQCFDAVEECGTPMVSIPGGEPLMHPQIDEIVKGLVSRRKYVYLCTNALLLDRYIDQMPKSPRLTFSIHLDGL